MIKVHQLSKVFKETRVVDALDLEIQKGEIFGLLGPNAAGKTTTIRMLCQLLKPTNGEVTIAGINLHEKSDRLKHSIAYVAQYFGLYDELTVLENLKFYASLYKDQNEKTLLTLLEKYQILNFKDAKAGSLSGGYKRRLSMCCALSHDPEVIFLDEPTAGIDPVTRKALWDIFYDLAEEGKTLFVTTHYMEEAQRCNRIAFLSKGKKVIEGTPKEVQNSLNEFNIYKNTQKFAHKLLRELKKNENIHFINQFGDELRFVVKKALSKEALAELLAPYIEEKVHLELAEPNLEDVFIALTQEEQK